MIGPFVFSPSVALSWAYDDNIFGTQDQPLSGSLHTARAALGLKLPFSHSYTALYWQPQYRNYGNYDAPRKTSQQLDFESRLNFASGSSLLFRNDYNQGYNEARRLSGENLQFSTTGFTRTNPALSYDWSFGGIWGVAGKLERTKVIFERTKVVDFEAFIGGSGDERGEIFDFFDYTSDALELRGYRELPRVRLYAAGVYGRTLQDRTKFNESFQENCRQATHAHGGCALSPIDSERIGEQEIDIGATGQILPATEADVKLGYVAWRFDSGKTPSYAGVSVSARLDHTFNRRTYGYFSFGRIPVQATGQAAGYYLRDEIIAGVERGLTMRLIGRAALTARRNAFRGQDAPFSFTDYSGEFGLRYRPGQASRPGPLLVNLTFYPLYRASSESRLNYDSQRVTLSVSYGWF